MVEIGRRLEGTTVIATLRDSRTVAGIANWSQVITLLLLVGGAVTGFLNRTRLEPWIPSWTWTVALVSALTAGLVTAAVLSTTNAIQDVRERRRRASNPGVKIKGIERLCKILSPSEAVYSYKFDVVVRQHNVGHFNYQFFYTGVGRQQVTIHNAGFQYLLRDGVFGPWNTLMILFDKPRGPGDRFVIEFDIRTDGSLKLPRPRYAVAIRPGIPKNADLLTIIFADTITLRRVWIEDYANESAPAPTAYRDVDMGRDRTVSWRLPSRVGRKFAINWEFG